MAIVALITMALLPLSMCRRLHHCQACVVALVTCCQAGIVALVAMALLPSMCRHLCIIVIVIAALMMMVLSPLSIRRHPCRCQDGVVALVTMALLPLIHDGVVALVMLHCPHPQAGIVAFVAMALPSSSMRRRPCRHCDGIVALVAMVLLPLMQRRLCRCCNGDCCPHCNGVSVVVELA
jgi:hypothetical protein